ncbi:4'-phosphopantetheinyl transferase superfamily protein [Pseudomonas saliphila]|uniref:4'-phosphopantetheinyl transferase superfamily protein n=1 Tax=Pseudomonas saliphila TaxID=2586906 RepID=UPI00123A0D80|nr:4'-phosphopantetheinyl transferase superfamily protein [Pseudomonas saliphila]
MPSQQVLLAVSALPASSCGALLSREARRLLSQLAADLGFKCPESGWSPRGAGPPRHTALPSNWFAGITHKRGLVIVGLSDGHFGIDLEHFNPRHSDRLEGLIDILPEPQVRDAIRQALSPQHVFYQAWTLHEAVFKLASQTDQPASSVFVTRIESALQAGDRTRLWQNQEWTLAVIGCASLSLKTDPASMIPGLMQVDCVLR